jgi:hypothetical protein
MIAYCVESPAFENGQLRGTFKLYTGDEQRAKDLCAEAPGRSYRKLTDDQIPPAAKANLIRAATTNNKTAEN